MNLGKDPWTPERVAVLQRLYALGWTASMIGRALRCTRNAVIGKSARLGLPKRVVPARPQKKPPKLKYPRPSVPASMSEAERENRMDTRDLRILDQMAAGYKPEFCAEKFHVEEAYVRDLWAAREAQG